MLNPQELYRFVCQQWQEEILPSLSDYIRIPNKSIAGGKSRPF